MTTHTFPQDAALSPLDGRYRKQTEALTHYLSEEALNRNRLQVEVEWLILFSTLGAVPGREPLTDEEQEILRQIPKQFDTATRTRLAEFERETRHDVKAVEYLLAERMRHAGDTSLPTWVNAAHILATSEDVNNLAVALGVEGAINEVWVPAAASMIEELQGMATKWADTPMLARTHGQSATPTTVGKELAVFTYRLSAALQRIRHAEYLGKFNGATGTYSAHSAVLPDVDWQAVSRQFVTGLGLSWNPLTTQIESHDWQIRLYSDITHFNRIAHNLATDMWHYISLGYFRQRLAAQGSTGSSTMPHKVNPIRFENAESNLELSNAVLDSLRETLSTTRFQRDLSDSSAQRNIGVGLGYSLIAISNLRGGLRGVEANDQVLNQDLTAHPEVIAEAIQQALRLSELSNPHAAEEGSDAWGPYERLKEATRGKTVTLEDLHMLIASLTDEEVLPAVRQRLLELTPETYTGLAPSLAVMRFDGN